MTFEKPSGTSLVLKENSAEQVFKEHKDEPVEDVPVVNNLRRFLLEGKVNFQKLWESKDVPRADIKDFEWFRTLGEGAFGRVLLARHKPTKIYCAVKVLDKARIINTKQLQHTYIEMKMLITLKFRFLVYMLYVMKDNSFLYFAMPFLIGGEMYVLLRKLGKFSEEQVKFYAVQICLALEYLHFLDVLHRDIKPENILIDQRGYLKLTDMGFCKIVHGRTYTFCGTPDYLAPEIILNKGYGKAVDWWSYGILLYEMRAGRTPFHAHDPMHMYAKIISGKYENASNFSKHFKHLISYLIQVDPTRRYGNLKNGVGDIKDHKWFKNVNWQGILNYQVTAPYLPQYTNDADTTNFPRHEETTLTVAEEDRFCVEFENF